VSFFTRAHKIFFNAVEILRFGAIEESLPKLVGILPGQTIPCPKPLRAFYLGADFSKDVLPQHAMTTAGCRAAHNSE
jgi:hypothetical protein